MSATGLGYTARAVLRPGIVLAFVFLCACSSERDPGPMRAAVEPHLEKVAEYDRWARRLGLADPAFRSEDALAEAAFAPLRDDSDVVAAWIDREGPDARSIAYPDDAPALPRDEWERVRTEELGDLEARYAAIRVGDEERRCLLVRRSAPAPGDAVLRVTLAFPAER
jgi:hypothetical protein